MMSTDLAAQVGEITEAEAVMIAKFKEELAPQIDQALALYLRSLTANLEKATMAELDRCITIVETCRLKAPRTIRGWNDAIDFALEQLRDWKKESARPMTAAELGAALELPGTPKDGE